MVGIVLYMVENLGGVILPEEDDIKGNGLLMRIAQKRSFVSAKVDKFLSTSLADAAAGECQHAAFGWLTI